MVFVILVLLLKSLGDILEENGLLSRLGPQKRHSVRRRVKDTIGRLSNTFHFAHHFIDNRRFSDHFHLVCGGNHDVRILVVTRISEKGKRVRVKVYTRPTYAQKSFRPLFVPEWGDSLAKTAAPRRRSSRASCQPAPTSTDTRRLAAGFHGQGVVLAPDKTGLRVHIMALFVRPRRFFAFKTAPKRGMMVVVQQTLRT